MKILRAYILREFLKILLLTTAAFMSVFLLVEFVERFNDLMERHVPFIEGLRFLFYKMPAIFTQTSPLAMLLATIITLGLFSRHGEITAIKAGGISILSAVSLLLIVGVLASGISIFINEAVVPAFNKKAMRFESRWLDKKSTGIFGREGLWLKAADGIYNIKKLDLKNDAIEGLTFFRLSEDYNPISRIEARSVKWQNKKWVVKDALVMGFTPEGAVRSSIEHGLVLSSLKPPSDLVSEEPNPKDMGFAELKAYIQELDSQDYSAEKYRVDLWSKLTFPLVNFIMVLVGLPFALRPGRRSNIADSVAISVVIAVGFWIVFAVSRTLGQNGAVPPILAAVFPDMLFLAVGMYLYTYVRQ
ncbi:MAG: LPS export ABC transporter permease LptG [Deltaproteobacteria bacterium]|nr:LPS export ABC transporter permease LptG [Deltaproteobacteria bacterium]